MKEELIMINKNGTWELTPKDKHVIGVKVVYRTKLYPDGSIILMVPFRNIKLDLL